jgi:hypothetical protein
MLKKIHPVQWIYRNLNLQIFNKWTNCGGNCITECGEGLMDVKSDGAGIEKVYCAGA